MRQNHTSTKTEISKKDLVLGGPRRKMNRVVAIGVLLVALAAAVVGYFFTAKSEAIGAKPTADIQSTDAAGEVVYPLSLFEDGQARHFEYPTDGLTVRYFILKSSDGVVRAAFDACDVCWQAGKGYFQQGDVMVCANCGRKFPSARINEVQGGCNPAPLNRIVRQDQLVLRAEDIAQGRQYFNF